MWEAAWSLDCAASHILIASTMVRSRSVIPKNVKTLLEYKSSALSEHGTELFHGLEELLGVGPVDIVGGGDRYQAAVLHQICRLLGLQI